MAKPIPAFPNGPFGLKIPPQLTVEGGEANVPPIRGDGSSNWTTIKTAVRRAAGESAETTAEIGRYRRDPNWSRDRKYGPAEALRLTSGCCTPRWVHVNRKEKENQCTSHLARQYFTDITRGTDGGGDSPVSGATAAAGR